MKNINIFKSTQTLFLLLGLILVLQACRKDNNGNNANAKIDFRLTDGPATYQAINIDVQELQIHTDVNGWQTFPLVRTGIYNILDFNNGLDVLLCSAELPVGKISQLRLVLGPNNTIIDNNITYPLSTPSAMQSGLKFNVHQTLEAGKTYTMWLDFDAAKSIVQTGNGDYKLKPVIRTYTALTDGRIEGTVLPLSAFATVYAIIGVDTFSAIPNANGYFKFCGLPQGTYQLWIDADAATPFTDIIIPSVAVSFGAINNVGIITLQ